MRGSVLPGQKPALLIINSRVRSIRPRVSGCAAMREMSRFFERDRVLFYMAGGSFGSVIAATMMC